MDAVDGMYEVDLVVLILEYEVHCLFNSLPVLETKGAICQAIKEQAASGL